MFLRLERITRLGALGEQLAAGSLRSAGFDYVVDLNEQRRNYPFADLLAERNGKRYLVGVKTRNEMRQGDIGLNASYNLVLINDAANKELKRQGLSVDEITARLLAQVHELASQHDAKAAWITVAVRPRKAEYSAYFGLVSDLGNRRSVPMTERARANYMCIADCVVDPRITADLKN